MVAVTNPRVAQLLRRSGQPRLCAAVEVLFCVVALQLLADGACIEGLAPGLRDRLEEQASTYLRDHAAAAASQRQHGDGLQPALTAAARRRFSLPQLGLAEAAGDGQPGGMQVLFQPAQEAGAGGADGCELTAELYARILGLLSQ